MKQTLASFDFVDINPGLSGLAFAAEAEGGVCVGVLRLKPAEKAAYEAFFGRMASSPPEVGSDLVLVQLPFSMFVRSERCDPAVSDLIVEAHRISRTAKAVLFRAPWNAAQRMGVEAEEYRTAVQAEFPAARWDVSSAVSDDLNDMFICAVSRKNRNGFEPLPTAFRPVPSPVKRENPQDTLVSMGYPAQFALRYADVENRVVDGITNVENARAAISSVLAAIR